MYTTVASAHFDEVTAPLTVPDGPWADPIRIPLDRPGAGSGPLAGTTVVVKDLYDVAGLVTTAGNPAFAAGRDAASADARAVTAVLEAGSRLVGTTITDELAYSLSGTNVHHGTPANPAAPGRVPGGSSAGSAAAVASGRADLALGTDTGGSVRVPASYCGIWGMRPTHGRIDLDGVVPLAPSFDTVGWFAGTAALLAAGGRALLADDSSLAPLHPDPSLPAVHRIVIAEDLIALADDAARDDLVDAATRLGDATALPVSVAEVIGRSQLEEWLGAFRVIQGAEAWAVHGDFLATDPPMGPGVRARFDAGGSVTTGQVSAAVAVRERARRVVESLTAGGTVLALPSAATVAPPVELDGPVKDDLRLRTLLLTCIAGLAGAPAVSAPVVQVDGLPIGLCLVGAPWSDEALLDLVEVAQASGLE
ncbi:MAG: amidase [Acidimicrobiales bacterium]